MLTQQAQSNAPVSEKHYRMLAESSPDWEYWIDADHRYRYVSPACESICGHPPAEFYADPELMDRLLHPLDRALWRTHHDQIFAPDGPRQAPISLRILTPQGEECWIEHVCVALYDETGQYLGQRGNNRDITTRKRDEARLFASEQVNRAIFEQAPIGIAHVGLDGGWLRVNNQLCEILGYPAGELLQQSFQTITHPDDFAADLIAIEKVIAGELRASSSEKRYIRKDGSLVWIHQRITLVLDADGDPSHFVALIEDISERKQADQERTLYQERLEAAVQQRTLELEAVNRDLEGFSYSVSHDLRAPLRAIDGFVAILLEDYAPQLDAEGQRLFGIVTDNAHKMGQLIDDILAISRAGRLGLEHGEIDMNALVDEVWAGFAGQRGNRLIEFHRDDLPPAVADVRALRQVWQNLLGNAIKFSQHRNPARIQVRAERQGDLIWYEVQDNGAGFNPDYAGKLFGLFQRLHDTNEFEGTGVGLAIVKRFIQKHGGEIRAEGVVNGGAKFRFGLPVRDSES